MSDDDLLLIEQEMSYTSYSMACKDATVSPNGDLRQCRRAHNHHGPHVSGYSASKAQLMWNQEP
jgi:hypothetical protein